MNLRPRLSGVDVLTTTPPRQPRKRAAELKALWFMGLLKQFFSVHRGYWKVLYVYVYENKGNIIFQSVSRFLSQIVAYKRARK